MIHALLMNKHTPLANLIHSSTMRDKKVRYDIVYMEAELDDTTWRSKWF